MKILLSFLLLFVVYSQAQWPAGNRPFIKPPPADCPNQVCPKGFECRNKMCTLIYPSRKFSEMSEERKKCWVDSDCTGEELCKATICAPRSEFERCTEDHGTKDYCGDVPWCWNGLLCRDPSDFSRCKSDSDCDVEHSCRERYCVWNRRITEKP